MISHLKMDPVIKQALNEDITTYDISSQAIFKNHQMASIELLSKDTGILAGLPVFQRTFEVLSPKSNLTFKWFKKEGDKIQPGELICLLTGPVQVLLTGERVALNFLQALSGIAAATYALAAPLAKAGIKVLDTRKTTPGLRYLEKYAVRVGGGYNHRYNLSDMIMLKDNHIAAAGGIGEAVRKARSIDPFIHKIEVECESLEMVEEAVKHQADIIMLDNFSIEDIDQALAIIDGEAVVECSGNINAENVHRYADRAIDYVSSGAITHSAGIVDLSMKNLVIKDNHLNMI
ncbi:MAG: carboxylating nicotinate-nucleotide diphosphorylase [Atopococcus tabaci]|uniref:Probable nicotinate-nucleotide pyrophosphorylase [carboxylating] n=1 Tax=Atopococcus tabaci TaxID=269774 RepID=A0AA43ZRZ7_9LACT|nr:carboxylating nicotinate-nucleotide diphosphorylase [Atopococcus tabaci]